MEEEDEEEDRIGVMVEGVVMMIATITEEITGAMTVAIEMMEEAHLAGVPEKTKISSRAMMAFTKGLDVADEEVDDLEEEAEEILTARINANVCQIIITRKTIMKVEEEDSTINPTIMIQITKHKDTEEEEDASEVDPFKAAGEVEDSIAADGAEAFIKITTHTQEEEQTSINHQRLRTTKAVLWTQTLQKLLLSILLRSFKIGEVGSAVVVGEEGSIVEAGLPVEVGMVAARMLKVCWPARPGFGKRMANLVMAAMLETMIMLQHLHRRRAE